MALQDLLIYNGPGATYPVIGRLFVGEGAGVAGISPDGGWWRIQCAIDIDSNCWVSADRTLTQAVNPGG